MTINGDRVQLRAQVAVIVFVLAWMVFYVGHCASVVATCRGHVMKNFVDWPVCVPSR